ncbi:MAG: hypothetical protein GPJ54_16945 [Candidatus Heimdallarchaeota archaeon]|nr:hypothetical protein [Candidatus Heimdallarchaeota archaeon]
MANNDSIIGGILVGIGTVSLIVEIALLVILPIRDGAPFESKIYWGMAIPLFLGVAGVLAILIWIGWTMIQTPPPEAWDFDDLEDELEDDDEDEKPKKAKASGELSIKGVSSANMATMIEAGFDTQDKIAAAAVSDLSALKGIGKVSAEKIIENAKN